QRDLGALHQLHQRQQTLPVLRQPLRQRASVLSADYLIVLLHGGSLLTVQRDSTRIARGGPPSLLSSSYFHRDIAIECVSFDGSRLHMSTDLLLEYETKS